MSRISSFPVRFYGLRRSAPRHAWVSGALSLFLPGVGHAYAGWYRSGALVFGGYVTLLLLWNFTAVFGMFFLAAGLVLGVSISLFSARDAWLLAQVTEIADAPPSMRRRVLSASTAFLVYLGVVAAVTSISPVKTYQITSFNMSPTLVGDDTVLADRRIYKYRAPRRGEVVAFRYPPHPARIDLSRIVAVAGDRIAIRHGRIVLNGKEIPQAVDEETSEHEAGKELMAWAAKRSLPPIRFLREALDGKHYSIARYESAPAKGFDPDFSEVAVEPGKVFVLDDHRGLLSDSRSWGQLPLANIEARARFVFQHHAGLGFRDWRNRSVD